MPKSLAEKLAVFANPEPEDIDPEDYERDSGSGSDSDAPEARAHYVEVGKSRLRSDELELDASKYGGERFSRKDLEEFDGRDFSEPEDDSGSDQESEEDDESDIGADLAGSKGDQPNGFSQSGSESEDQGQSESDSDTPASLGALDNGRNGEVMRIMKQEQKHMVSRLSEAVEQDIERGKAVHAQTKVHEGLLDARITLQKVLNLTNVLPEDSNQDAGPALNAITELLESVVALRRQMAGKELQPKSKGKRNFAQMVQETEELDTQLAEARESTLTKWSRKVQLSSGSSVLKSAKFKSLNQSAATQVSGVLGDMDRLVKRTKVNRSQYLVPGVETPPQEHDDIFDDTDFYRLLLKDLVDRRMAESASTGGVRWKAAQNKAKKTKDNRVSKGRKLRYDVQEKVQGFDAPHNVLTWTNEQAEELFSHLLGQSITMDDEEPQDESEDDEISVDADFAIFA